MIQGRLTRITTGGYSGAQCDRRSPNGKAGCLIAGQSWFANSQHNHLMSLQTCVILVLKKTP
jgi:hypothetical protein